jgi:ABC-type phosphate/phosphonate transport system permease subunit
VDGGVVAARDVLTNRLGAESVLLGMKLYRFVPVLVLALAVLALVSACGGKGGGGY